MDVKNVTSQFSSRFTSGVLHCICGYVYSCDQHDYYSRPYFRLQFVDDQSFIWTCRLCFFILIFRSLCTPPIWTFSFSNVLIIERSLWSQIATLCVIWEILWCSHGSWLRLERGCWHSFCSHFTLKPFYSSLCHWYDHNWSWIFTYWLCQSSLMAYCDGPHLSAIFSGSWDCVWLVAICFPNESIVLILLLKHVWRMIWLLLPLLRFIKSFILLMVSHSLRAIFSVGSLAYLISSSLDIAYVV